MCCNSLSKFFSDRFSHCLVFITLFCYLIYLCPPKTEPLFEVLPPVERLPPKDEPFPKLPRGVLNEGLGLLKDGLGVSKERVGSLPLVAFPKLRLAPNPLLLLGRVTVVRVELSRGS